MIDNNNNRANSNNLLNFNENNFRSQSQIQPLDTS
jgi:hypothetical protein